jgi:hypothetical protein
MKLHYKIAGTIVLLTTSLAVNSQQSHPEYPAVTPDRRIL